MTRKLGTTRKFDGKTFQYFTRSYSKKECDKAAKLLRGKGWKARVTKRKEKVLGRIKTKCEVWRRK